MDINIKDRDEEDEGQQKNRLKMNRIRGPGKNGLTGSQGRRDV